MIKLRIKYLCVRIFLFALFLQMPILMSETFLMNDEIIRAKIALHYLNKIGVKNDKIVSVSGNDGAYFFEKNEKHGFGFIKPSLENGNNSISLNITTASGKTQGLLLDVDDCDPQTIELQSDQNVASSPANVFADIGDYASELSLDNSSNDYESSVIEAMKLFILGRGIQKLDLENSPKRNANGITTGDIFKIEFLEAYRIRGFIGYKFKVTTEIETCFAIQESSFSQKGDVALSFSSLIISKNRPVTLYVLRQS